MYLTGTLIALPRRTGTSKLARLGEEFGKQVIVEVHFGAENITGQCFLQGNGCHRVIECLVFGPVL